MPFNQRGFTLLEWLISVSLGLFLLTLTSTLYTNLYKTSAQMRGAFETSENSEIALRFLTRDIRMSGFIGCPNVNEVTIPTSIYIHPNSIMGWGERFNTWDTPSFIRNLHHTGDILYLQYADPDRKNIVYAKDNSLQLSPSNSFTPKEILLISDCKHAEILQLDNIQLKYTYKEDASISRFYRMVYYVAPTKRKNRKKQTIYALYRKDLNTPDQPTELVENIEKLELLYGVIDKTHTLQDIPAHQIKDWDKVRSVTFTLHVTGQETSTTPKLQPLKEKMQQTVMVRSRFVN